ncbi:MAG: sulfatase [Verrucomicrobiota bacterium]
MPLFSRCLCLWLVLAVSPLVAAEKPNFLVILLDDAGWTDVGCFGSRIETPNIDRLATEGMRFTDCHSAAPNCSPSRAGLLTGRTPSRLGIYSYLPTDHVMHLRDEEITIAELLKQEGYATGHFGKWHISKLLTDQPQPSDQGFDYSFATDNNAAPSHHNPGNFVRNGERVGELEGYSCQLVVDESLTWLEKLQESESEAPFFACVWFHEPHTPIASPPELVAKYQKLFPDLSKKEATYHANIENVDLAVGRLLAKLEEWNLAEDTMIFLTSDNGPLNNFSRVGLRGKKSNVWEGGHRVFGMMRWPKRIQAGSECDVAISGVDFLPTVCEITGMERPSDRKVDGTSILPLLEGRDADFERGNPLYWFFYRLNPSLAMRDGDWALVASTTDGQRPKAHPLTREDMPKIRDSELIDFQLYNLNDDLEQQKDHAKSNPEVLDRLRQKAIAMHRDVIAEGHYWDIPESYGATSKRKVWNSE